MTQVKLNQAISGHASGATIEVTPASAAYLINVGAAEAIEAPTKRATKAPAKSPTKEVGGASPANDPVTAG